MGPHAEKAVPALIAILDDEKADAAIREHVISALGEIGPGAEQAIPVLERALEREFDGRRRKQIAAAIEQIRRPLAPPP